MDIRSKISAFKKIFTLAGYPLKVRILSVVGIIVVVILIVGALFLTGQSQNTARINRLVIDGGTWLYINKIEEISSVIREKLESIKFKQTNNHDASEDLEYAVEYGYELVEGVQNYNLQDLTDGEIEVGKSFESITSKISESLEQLYDSFPPENKEKFVGDIDKNIENLDILGPSVEKAIEYLQASVGSVRTQMMKQAKINNFLKIFVSFIIIVVISILFIIINSISNPIKHEVENLNRIISSSTETSNDCQSLSTKLSNYAAQQLEAITETAASCEQISQTLKVNLDQADEGEIISKKSLESIDSMMKSTKDLVNSIENLKTSNENMNKFIEIIDGIQDKTSLIDEIVFQTKLLSFNASVEAERAGEYGRGFGVVAQEIGTLAKNSGSASVDIANLIKNSLKQVEVIINDNSMS